MGWSRVVWCGQGARLTGQSVRSNGQAIGYLHKDYLYKYMLVTCLGKEHFLDIEVSTFC